MRLTELEPQFLRHERVPVPANEWYEGHFSPLPYRDLFHYVDALAGCHGISFLCPKSFAKNSGPIGTHKIRVYFEGSPVPPEIGTNLEGKTVRWQASGTGYADLTLSPSIFEQPIEYCGWHGFVRNGEVANA